MPGVCRLILGPALLCSAGNISHICYIILQQLSLRSGLVLKLNDLTHIQSSNQLKGAERTEEVQRQVTPVTQYLQRLTLTVFQMVTAYTSNKPFPKKPVTGLRTFRRRVTIPAIFVTTRGKRDNTKKHLGTVSTPLSVTKRFSTPPSRDRRGHNFPSSLL